MKKLTLTLALIFSLGISNGVCAIENIVSYDEIEQSAQPQIQKTEKNINESLKAEISFDWLDISLAQREENINKYKKLLFEENSTNIYFTKDEFKKKFESYKKDKEYKHHYMLTNNGVTEDEDAKYCAFYYKKGTLVMYAIQYKNNPTNAFYYTAFGKLYYTDLMSKEYPNFPYTSMQYDRKGQLKSAIYFVSKDLQYMFDANKQFQGIWYKDKMYNIDGKQTLTRTNW